MRTFRLRVPHLHAHPRPHLDIPPGDRGGRHGQRRASIQVTARGAAVAGLGHRATAGGCRRVDPHRPRPGHRGADRGRVPDQFCHPRPEPGSHDPGGNRGARIPCRCRLCHRSHWRSPGPHDCHLGFGSGGTANQHSPNGHPGRRHQPRCRGAGRERHRTDSSQPGWFVARASPGYHHDRPQTRG